MGQPWVKVKSFPRSRMQVEAVPLLGGPRMTPRGRGGGARVVRESRGDSVEGVFS